MRTTTARMTVDIIHDPRAIPGLLTRIDELAQAHRLPATMSGAWLRACLRPHDHVWAVTVSEPALGLQAAALFINHQDPAETTLVGAVDGHPAGIPGATTTALETLATAMASQLTQLTAHGRRAVLGPLRLDHTTALLISALYGSVRVLPAEPIPAVRKQHNHNLASYLTAGTRKTLRKAANRLHTDGRTMEIEFTRDATIISSIAHQLAEMRRARDIHHSLTSPLDSPDGRLRWYGRLEAIQARGAAELGRLRIDQQLAAYILAVKDGSHYRVLEGCLDSQWARYSPGRLIEAAAIQRFLDNRELLAIDWMTDTATDSLIAVNHREMAVILYLHP